MKQFDGVFTIFTVISYNFWIFLNNRKLISSHLISILGSNLSFAYDFQRHKQEVTQVKLTSLVLQK